MATIDPCAVEPKGGTARHRLHQVASAVINSSDASLMQTLMNAKRVVVVYKDKVIKIFLLTLYLESMRFRLIYMRSGQT